MFLFYLVIKLEDLRRRLQEAEDSRLEGKKDLTEAHRELQGCVQERDKLRKEALELRRELADETREREAIQVSNQELRASIKREESENNRCSHPTSLDMFLKVYFCSKKMLNFNVAPLLIL